MPDEDGTDASVNQPGKWLISNPHYSCIPLNTQFSLNLKHINVYHTLSLSKQIVQYSSVLSWDPFLEIPNLNLLMNFSVYSGDCSFCSLLPDWILCWAFIFSFKGCFHFLLFIISYGWILCSFHWCYFSGPMLLLPSCFWFLKLNIWSCFINFNKVKSSY